MWSTPDLSDITFVIKGLLDEAVQNSSLQSVGNIKVNCDSPETVRAAGGHCFLTLYLLHIGRDPYWRNTPVSGPRGQLNSGQPLSLNLSYLLTAYCEKDAVLEQRAMSIALQAIHGTPIVNQKTAPTDPFWTMLPDGEFVISIEADTIEEMSRLWQAFTVPIRLSALIRASVVFIAPVGPVVPPSQPPTVANLTAAPAPDPGATAPLLVAGLGLSTPPLAAGATVEDVTLAVGPLVAVAGGALTIAGDGLAAASAVYLTAAGSATEWDVTQAWRRSVSAGELDLLLPAAYGDPSATPPGTPPPGLYTLSVGAGAARSNAIPLAIAPSVVVNATPPLLQPNSAKIYAIAGAGFIADGTRTRVAVGAAALAYSAAATPAAGQFTVDSAGATIQFMLPSPLATGAYPVLVSVNGVAAGANWVVAAP
jgi:hypothetical protein